MNLDEARDGIGRKVLYSPLGEPDFDDETGVIDSVGDHLVFVRYGGQQRAKPTNPGDLRFADDEPARWEPRLAAHAAGVAPFKFARPGDWKRSSFHQPTRLGDCPEVYRYGDGVVGVRDARRPDEKALLFSPESWQAFIAGVKAGEFDFGEVPADER